MIHLIAIKRSRRILVLAPLLAIAPLLGGGAQAQTSMQNMPGMGAAQPTSATTASGIGSVETVNAEQRKIKLNHEPIPALSWPAMSMEFPAAASVDLSKVKPGAKVRFTLRGSGGAYTIESISPAQ